MADNTYMGRVFLAPKYYTKVPDQCELWVNFGWNSKRNQMFPDYYPAFAPACTAEQYSALAKEIKTYLDQNGSDLQYASCMMCLCMTCPCIFWPCCCAMSMQANAITKEVRTIIETMSKGWTLPARLEFCQFSQRVCGEEVAKDHLGRDLETTIGSDAGVTPVWPPLGYNLVITVGGGDEFRRGWGAAGAVPLVEGMMVYGRPVAAPAN